MKIRSVISDDLAGGSPQLVQLPGLTRSLTSWTAAVFELDHVEGSGALPTSNSDLGSTGMGHL